MRDKIEAAITAWERKAKGEMRLDAYLDARCKAELIDGIMRELYGSQIDMAEKAARCDGPIASAPAPKARKRA